MEEADIVYPGEPVSPQPADELAEPFTGMRYFRMVSYVFDHPQWGMTLLLATVCQFIPVIGNILLMGYQYDIVEQLHRGRRRYPEFNFDNFVPYLYRGLWPFLVSLVVGLCLMPVLLVFGAGLALLPALLELDPEKEPFTLVAILVPALLLALLLIIFTTLFVMPMALRAGLSQQFREGLRLAWVRDFVGRVWLEILLGTLFLMLVYFVLLLVGMALCFVGIYPAVTILFLAQAHLYYQLYSLYLLRGGTPVPLQDASPVGPR